MLLGLLEPSSGSIRLFGQDFIRDRFFGSWSDELLLSPYVDLPQRLTVREKIS